MSEKIQVKDLKIVHSIPDDLQTQFANHFVIQHQSDHFILSLFQILPPIIFDEIELETLLKSNKLDEIEAKCIARIIITPKDMESLSATMQDNIRKYKEKLSLLEDKKDE